MANAGQSLESALKLDRKPWNVISIQHCARTSTSNFIRGINSPLTTRKLYKKNSQPGV